MARRKVIDLNADSTVSFEKPGQKLEGYYIGFKEVTTDYGPSKLHVFQTATGNVGAWGSAQLDSKLATVPKGSMTWITFLKKTKVPKGTLKNFNVEFDDDERIDVEQVSITQSKEAAEAEEPEATAEAEETAEEPEAEAEEEMQDVDPEEPEAAEEEEAQAPPPAQPKKGTATGVTAEQKARAQAVLNGNNKPRPAAAAKKPAA